jgi:hypothetical protein
MGNREARVEAQGRPRLSNPAETQDQASPDRSQIKSRARVRNLAEVYTHEREVNAMLDLVPEMFPGESDPGNTDRTFLEPACGSGNFLVEIFRRKLNYVTPRRYGRGERFEHRILRSLASIYGIDIGADNIEESRGALRLNCPSLADCAPSGAAIGPIDSDIVHAGSPLAPNSSCQPPF